MNSTEAVAGVLHDPPNAQARTLIDVQCPTILQYHKIKETETEKKRFKDLYNLIIQRV